MDAIYRELRRARIAAGLTQAALAAQVGCTQSAVSMMEAGRAEALSRESLEKLAKILNVTLPGASEAKPQAFVPGVGGAGAAVCPGFNCPTNLPYAVGSDVFFMPLGTAGGGRHCVFCGELLMRRCPACDAPLSTPGGCCAACGAAIVTMPDGYVDDPQAWIDRRLATIEALARRS
ncbi:MAG: helix-turn-helix domain-containing protein [Kiritimatiellia bacterium]